MVQSNEEERHRFNKYRERLLKVGEIVALTADILALLVSVWKRGLY
jgi:hypothetical protein